MLDTISVSDQTPSPSLVASACETRLGVKSNNPFSVTIPKLLRFMLANLKIVPKKEHFIASYKMILLWN